MKRTWESLTLLGFGLTLIALSINGGTPSMDERGLLSLAWYQLAFFYGVVFAVLAAVSYGLGLMHRSLLACVLGTARLTFSTNRVRAQALESLRHVSGFGLVFLVIALAIGTRLRWDFLMQPMRLDESFSFLTFVNAEWSNVFLYHFPNNHVLNTILEKLSCAVVGPGPIGIRLPAFLSGLALIPLVYAFSRKLGNECSGLLAALGVAVWPYLVLFSTNGRGYSLLALLAVAMAYVAIDFHGKFQRSRLFPASVLCALGMLTVPSMLFPMFGIGLWMICTTAIETRDWRVVVADYCAPFVMMSLILTALFYTPVVLVSGGLQGVTANKEAVALSLSRFLHQAGAHISHAAHALVFDVPGAALALVLVMALVGFYASCRSRRISASLLLPCMVIGSAALFLLKRSIPFPRTWLYLIPFLLVAADIGLGHVLVRASRSLQWLAGGALTIGACLLARHLMLTNAIGNFPETGIAPSAETLSRKMIDILTAEDFVCASIPDNGIVAYELWRNVDPSELRNRQGSQRVFWLHRKPSGPSRGLQTGWRTIAESDYMVGEQWTMSMLPSISNELDCWQPAAARRWSD